MSRLVEQGDVFFFYRPRVGLAEAHDLQGVQRFFFVLTPEGKGLYRRIIVGRKRLPDPRGHERIWAFVAEVADQPEELRDELRSQAYETRTRGVRVVPPARPVGEGRYGIAEHDGHTHLAYLLELPRKAGPAQDAFRIRPEASCLVAVRNPLVDVPSGAGMRPEQRAKYPPELQERFGDRRFISVGDPRLLDYEGAEIVLIGAAENVREELGIDLEPRTERVENADIFQKLRTGPEELPTEALEHGRLR
jgi:hypothetical protein